MRRRRINRCGLTGEERPFYYCSISMSAQIPSLFGEVVVKKAKRKAPLADRMRPKTFDEMVGQEALVGSDAAFRKLVEAGKVPSCIFWGPPGTGKTTLAEVIAEQSEAQFVPLSAVTAGVAELRSVVAKAQADLSAGKRTIVFIDEIHRFNKGQQDALLPYVERGTIIFIGATTENPSFEVNRALLSRSNVYVLASLEEADLHQILKRALTDTERGIGNRITIEPEAESAIVRIAQGDARAALNMLEIGAQLIEQKKEKKIRISDIQSALQKTKMAYDKNGEEHYNVISALHKSLRGSDADAALYWLARMLEAGEDPIYVARRLVRFAAEDVGVADSNALVQAIAGMQAVHWIGMPECNVHLAQVTVYLAKTKKSNALYTAYKQAAKDAKETSHLGVPLHLRNAPTDLMKDLGYGKGYKYNPAYTEPVIQDYFPPELKKRKYL